MEANAAKIARSGLADVRRKLLEMSVTSKLADINLLQSLDEALDAVEKARPGGLRPPQSSVQAQAATSYAESVKNRRELARKSRRRRRQDRERTEKLRNDTKSKLMSNIELGLKNTGNAEYAKLDSDSDSGSSWRSSSWGHHVEQSAIGDEDQGQDGHSLERYLDNPARQRAFRDGDSKNEEMKKSGPDQSISSTLVHQHQERSGVNDTSSERWELLDASHGQGNIKNFHHGVGLDQNESLSYIEHNWQGGQQESLEEIEQEEVHVWLAVVVVELAQLKVELCKWLDHGSAQLAFWRDLESMPVRKFVLHVANFPSPILEGLEDAMLVLMEALGDCEMVLRNVAQRWTKSSLSRRRGMIRKAIRVQKRLAVLGEFDPLCAAEHDHVPLKDILVDLGEHIVFVKTELPHRLEFFMRCRTRHTQIPRSWRFYWPEGLAFTAVGLGIAYAAASGHLQRWLDSTSLARRGVHSSGGLSHDASISTNGELMASLFSWDHWASVWGHFRDKARVWINTKILNHVTTPTRNMINELINYRELEAKIEIFNKEDAVILHECQMQLQELIHSEALDRAGRIKVRAQEDTTQLPPAASALEERLTGTALAQFTPAHELLVRNPHRTLLGGSKALRPLLVNLYFVKAEIYYVLKAMHVLKRGANFHFELMAIVPAILAARGALRAFHGLLFSRSRKFTRGAFAVSQRLRYILRDLEQLANLGAHDSSDPVYLGRYVMLAHQFHATFAEHIESRLTRAERARFADFARALVEAPNSGPDGLSGRFLAVLDPPAL